MRELAYATHTSLSTPRADLSLLDRDCAALRLLRMMQAWAAEHVIEPGRGAVWIARDWLRSKLGVSRSQYFRALARLRESGWISDRHVADESGRERSGFHVALRAEHGYATDMRPTCDSDATDMRPRCDFPTLKLREENLTESGAAMSRDTRQSSLPGISGAPAKPARSEGQKGRDPRLRPVAERLDAYERLRYSEHPRCTRPKRSTPEAIAISVEAITRALERVVASGVYETLDAIEERLRAAVELNWEAAERKVETWEWWTGSKLWAPQSLDRVLGWLDEPRNVVYLNRATGEFELPRRADAQAPAVDVSELSPAEQQAAYDAVGAGGVRFSICGVTCTPASGEFVDYTPPSPDITVMREGDFMVGDSDEPVHLEAGDVIEREAMEQLSDCIERGDAPGLAELMDSMFIEMSAETRVPMELLKGSAPGGMSSHERTTAIGCVRDLRDECEDDRRKLHERKLVYFKATTPEQRDADSKAGRKPWEVG